MNNIGVHNCSQLLTTTYVGMLGGAREGSYIYGVIKLRYNVECRSFKP